MEGNLFFFYQIKLKAVLKEIKPNPIVTPFSAFIHFVKATCFHGEELEAHRTESSRRGLYVAPHTSRKAHFLSQANELELPNFLGGIPQPYHPRLTEPPRHERSFCLGYQSSSSVSFCDHYMGIFSLSKIVHFKKVKVTNCLLRKSLV